MLGIVGQILVQVGQAGRISTQLVIHHPQLVASCHLPASMHLTIQTVDIELRCPSQWSSPNAKAAHDAILTYKWLREQALQDPVPCTRHCSCAHMKCAPIKAAGGARHVLLKQTRPTKHRP